MLARGLNSQQPSATTDLQPGRPKPQHQFLVLQPRPLPHLQPTLQDLPVWALRVAGSARPAQTDAGPLCSGWAPRLVCACVSASASQACAPLPVFAETTTMTRNFLQTYLAELALERSPTSTASSGTHDPNNVAATFLGRSGSASLQTICRLEQGGLCTLLVCQACILTRLRLPLRSVHQQPKRHATALWRATDILQTQPLGGAQPQPPFLARLPAQRPLALPAVSLQPQPSAQRNGSSAGSL